MIRQSLRQGKSLLSAFLLKCVRRFSGTITRVATNEPLVALTFDDSPAPASSEPLLEVLAKHRAKATFFVIGQAAQAHPRLVDAIADAGHAIGNHSWNHPSFPLLSGRERRSQVRRCHAVLREHDSKLFRPPYGHQSCASQVDARLCGYQVIMFDVVVSDWLVRDADSLAEEAIGRVSAGSIIVMHDALYDYIEPACLERESSRRAVDKILASLSSRFRFVTVPELLRAGRPVRENWFMKPDCEFLNRLNRPSGPAPRYEAGANLRPLFGFNR